MPRAHSLTIRSVKKWGRAFASGIFSQNPVLTGGIGLYMVLSGSTSLMGALLLSLLLLALTVPVCSLCWLAGKRIAVWLRLPLAFLVTGAIYLPLYTHLQKLYPQPWQALGLCGVLAAADCLLLMRAFAPEKRRLPLILAEALGGTTGFAVVLLAVSAMWSVLDGMEKAGGGAFSQARVVLGLIAVALLAALWQYGINRHRRRKGGERL